MKFLKIKLLFVLLIVSFAAMAQNTDANIFGHVIDKYTGEHLPYVNVVVKGTKLGASTDESGHYYITNLPEGNQVVEASCVGYKTTSIEVAIVKGQSHELNIAIEVDAQVMKDVVVSASRVEVNRKEAAVVVNVLNPKALDRVNAVNLAEGLNFQPGLRVENTCQNCGANQVRINGLEGKYSQILIDSRPVFSALAGVYGLEQIPVSMIDRISVRWQSRPNIISTEVA